MRVQLQRLPDLVAARRGAATRYAERLADVDGIELPVALDTGPTPGSPTW